MKKKLAVFLVCFFLIVETAHALLPLLYGGFYVAAGASGFTLSDAFAISIVAHGALLLYSIISSDSSGSSSSSPTPLNTVEVKLVNDAKRDNPDPTKWDDATGNTIDPTPKIETPPSNISGATVSSGGGSVALNGNLIELTPSDSVEVKASSAVAYFGVPRTTYYLKNAAHNLTYPTDAINTTQSVTVAGKEIASSKYSGPSQWFSSDMRVKYTWNQLVADLSPKKVYLSDSIRSTNMELVSSSVCWLYSSPSCPNSSGFDSSPNVLDGYTYQGYPPLSGHFSVQDTGMYCNPDSRFPSSYKCAVERLVYRTNDVVVYGSQAALDVNKYKLSLDLTDVVRVEKIGASVVLHQITRTQLCEAGQYFDTKQNACVQGNAPKPSTTPCQIVYHNGAWEKDSSNPNCSTTSSNYAVAGNVVQVLSGNQRIQVEAKSDGTKEITLTDGTKWRQASVSSSGDGVKLNSVTDSATGSMYGLGDAFPKVGNGNTLINNSQGGACGGKDQPKCSIDDSGFDGKGQQISGEFDKLNSAEGKYKSDLEGKGNDLYGKDFGFKSDWFPRLWPAPVQCENLVINMTLPVINKQASATIDFCEKAQSIKVFFHWLFYFGGVLYIFRRLTRANSTEA